MVMAVTALLERNESPSENEVMDAIGGVLCRCTGYRKIVQAALDVNGFGGVNGVVEIAAPAAGEAIGKRLVRLDGKQKVTGTEIFGADETPAGSLAARVIRSPFDRARFQFGDIDEFVRTHAGIAGVFTAKDIPGKNCFGVIAIYADQPVFAELETRFRGEAVACVVGEPEVLEALGDLKTFPVTWEELPALKSVDAAETENAALIHSHRPGNVLVRGRVACGDVTAALAEAEFEAAGEFESGFVEHAYIEPEAGFARRVGDTIEVQACTQAPYMDRADLAAILALAPEAVRVIPTAVGGGFGSKLDLSMQPFVALAAWRLRRPVRMVYSRTESMMSTTKRHPSRIRARVAADRRGKLTAMDFSADFNTGAYSSWGPTVAARVPIHASGPYRIPHYRAETRAVHTNLVPAGAFRGFGVPQTALAQEQLFDELANRVGMDRLEFRILNALDAGTPTVTGQVLGDGVGIRACFEALQPRWTAAGDEAKKYNAENRGPLRRGIGVAGVWYGCGNTSLPNPSTVRVGLKADGRIAMHQGAVDIGQGSATVIPQICADALGVPIDRFDFISGDTSLSPDCGKTSASRQTFVSGKAASMAGIELRRAILQLAGGCECARFTLGDGCVTIVDGQKRRCISLRELPLDANGYVATGEATFDPPTKKLDEDGQGIPYAVYGFGAQMAEVSVDMELGTVKVLRITAAHDVGRAINPTLVEGQIEGGIAQGLGMALMEEFFPGRGENLHDYLIPTVGDIPPIESILIEDPSSVGPSGAKGIGEHSMVATAPAILNAIYDAAGVRVHKVPATPARVRAAILAAAATKPEPGQNRD
jgi:CO/xanthine dehydrogenase Mo-binding subunit